MAAKLKRYIVQKPTVRSQLAFLIFTQQPLYIHFSMYFVSFILILIAKE